ncbi:MAG: hypothetical protein DRN29_05710 [Thermoplasmata archaeon]|nr:MAG: hypothetical protein DRN29_05710 [Thermoplasmata archaeon]
MGHKISKFIVVFVVVALLSAGLSGCISKKTYMVEMRDGIHLATDVYLPKKKSLPHGTILIRTPYNKDKLQRLGVAWALYGWPVVIQDMRGRFASEGVDTVFRKAHTDGPDTLEWIASQSWCNGKVATFGASALGICQYFMAGANPPNLACQYIGVATPNIHHHAIFQGGEFRKNLMETWLNLQNSTFILPEWFAHENYTLDYWTNVTLDDKWQNVNIPAIHIGGWYDIFTQGTIDGFMGYQYNGGTGARGKSRLIIGPWSHSGGSQLQQGELTYPENAKDNFSMAMFSDMIDEYTMNGPDDFDKWPAVTYYVMGDVYNESAPGNAWLTSDKWPVEYDATPFYFHEDGTLSDKQPSTYSFLSFAYDPTNPVPTIGGRNLYMPMGPYDQRMVENRDDVLVFTTPVLNKPVWITGPVKARLYVSSDCPDTDFTVKLCDVYPDGKSMLIADGILRMRNRNGFDHWEFMEPGKVYGIDVDLWSTSYIWNAGHKIRVSISSSNSPRFLPNPNTREPIGQNKSYRIAHNTVYLSPIYPSSIILPVIDKNFEQEAQNTSSLLNALVSHARQKIISRLMKNPSKAWLADYIMQEWLSPKSFH